MHAIVLAGGKGSRLRPFTFTIPKPLVPIGEVPILEILITQLAAQGFERITISTGHLASLIRGFCGDGSQWGVPIDYVHEHEPLGTAGGLSLIEGIDGDRVFVINGDTLTDMDFASAYRAHDPEDAITIFSNRRRVEIEFGVVEGDADGYLADYQEKPMLSYQVSMGVNAVSTWAIEKHLPEARRIDMPDFVSELQAAGGGVRIRETDAYWLDLGRMSDLEAGNEVFTKNPERFLPQ